MCEDTKGINLNVGTDRIILPDGVTISDLTADTMCPEDKPFYNEFDCINCEDPTPYFNYQIISCVNCADNEEYSS